MAASWKHLPLWTAALGLALALPARAFNEDYLPLSEDERFQRFPQQHLYSEAPCTPGPHEVAEVGARGVRFEPPGEEGGVVLSGEDRQGRPFRVALGGAALGCALYRADLDKNGTQDLVLHRPTGGNGLAPSAHVVAVLFDEAGRPMPWEADGYFEQDEHGVVDLLDLDEDGKAELVRQAHGEGWWLTSLYEAEAGHWRRVQGRHGERSWPLATRFTKRPNTRVGKPPGRGPFEVDLSNGVPAAAQPVRLKALEFGAVERSEDPVLTLEDGRTCRPRAWSSSLAVVVDRAGGREAALLSAPQAARTLLQEVLERKLPVVLAGQRQRGSCTPELVLAREPESSAPPQ